MLDLLLDIVIIVYCTFAFGIHGGELISNVNRQLRNFLCVLPFGLVFYLINWQLGLLCFLMSYGGVSLGFAGQLNYIRLALKGALTCPIGGFIVLPLIYFLSYKTKYTNMLAEYGSGTAYGIILALVYHAAQN